MRTRLVCAIGCFALLTAAHAAVNVRDVGAQGDGKNDDGPAIAAAVAAVQAGGGGTVDFPEGDYLLGTPAQPDVFIRLASGVSLVGHGRARLLSQHNTALFSGVGVHDIRVENLCFQSPERAFYLDRVDRLTITRCEFLDHQPMAIYGKRGSEVDVTACRFVGSAYGLYLPKARSIRTRSCVPSASPTRFSSRSTMRPTPRPFPTRSPTTATASAATPWWVPRSRSSCTTRPRRTWPATSLPPAAQG